MVKVSVGDDAITLSLEGTRKFLALKGNITIPLENIVKISTEQVKPLWLPRMRLGAHVPGVFMAGTFWVKQGKTFYFVRDFSRCITLHLRSHEYSRVIIQVDDKESVAQKLRNAMQ